MEQPNKKQENLNEMQALLEDCLFAPSSIKEEMDNDGRTNGVSIDELFRDLKNPVGQGMDIHESGVEQQEEVDNKHQSKSGCIYLA